AEKESAFVPYTHPRALKHILCYRGVYRKVGSGQTISYQGHTYKIVSDRILPLKTEVEVRQTLDGSVCIEHSGEILFVKRRSEERRVGKECRSRWGPDDEVKKERCQEGVVRCEY